MSQKGIVTLVSGYHPETPVPKQAHKESLTSRFAVLFETASPNHESAFFQAELFIKLISAIQTRIESDLLEIEVDESAKYRTIYEFEEFLLELDEPERMPPRRISFCKNHELICLEETEFWALCGGPAPYSDSYTAAFYTKEDADELLDTVCASVCSDMDVTIRARIQGAPRAQRAWWKRLFFSGECNQL